MKRSNTMKVFTVGLLSVSAFALTSCGEEKVESFTFQNVEACYTEADKSESDNLTRTGCNVSYAESKKQFEETAPRFAEKKLCEEEFGVGNCETKGSHASGGGFFMPFWVGYMIGNSMNNGVYRNYAAPVYSAPGGGYRTYGSSSTFKNFGKFSTGVSAYSSAPKASSTPITRSVAVARGGFGRSSVSVGG